METIVKKVVMVSGHLDLTVGEFAKYYAPQIKKRVNEGCHFILGAAEGADELAHKYLLTFPTAHATVYNRKGKKNHVPNSRFIYNAIFESYRDRDNFLIDNSDEQITYIRQYGGAGSDLFGGLLRRAFLTVPPGELSADLIVKMVPKLVRDSSMVFDKKVLMGTLHDPIQYIKRKRSMSF